MNVKVNIYKSSCWVAVDPITNKIIVLKGNQNWIKAEELKIKK